MNVVDEIIELFERRGADAYFGEPVSQLEHALQTALQAEQESAPDTLVAAALLHDIGHLLHKLPEDVADRGVDGRHERIGATLLARYFPPAVTEPIRLHVAAKRYFCSIDAGYQRRLSAASIQSLALQGGPMSVDEVREFETSAYASMGVRLRRWDDQAKVAGWKTPGLAKYRSLLEKLARHRER
ncbi:MAG TPA: phosphonate degradation HD-domain oxygenase [Blastocatellia bacterium]|jgi:phosphonate degradation associated HDIG domain protein